MHPLLIDHSPQSTHSPPINSDPNDAPRCIMTPPMNRSPVNHSPNDGLGSPTMKIRLQHSFVLTNSSHTPHTGEPQLPMTPPLPPPLAPPLPPSGTRSRRLHGDTPDRAAVARGARNARRDWHAHHIRADHAPRLHGEARAALHRTQLASCAWLAPILHRRHTLRSVGPLMTLPTYFFLFFFSRCKQKSRLFLFNLTHQVPH